MLIAAVIIWWVQDHIFFWDTIQLGAKHAYWYFDQSFQHFLLPQEIDSGHPPLFGMYLAAIWMLFGKSLAISHWAMLPFLWGALWFAYRIGDDLGGWRSAWFLPLLLLADPVFMGQAVLVSPDLVLVSAFLVAFYGMLSKQQAFKIAGLLLLALISMRGMMCVLMLFVFEVLGETSFWVGDRSLPRQVLQKIPSYLPAGILASTFLCYHFYQTGWIGYHPDSPWSPSFESVDFKGFLRNTAILGWRIFDYGRFFECLVIIIAIWMVWRREAVLRLELLPWLLLVLLALLILSPSLLMHRYLSAHRYLLPFFISLHLLIFQLLLLLPKSYRQRRWWLLPVLVGLATGNLWIYPQHIAQGWDATLAHLPYYELRAEMLEYIEQEEIPLETIGTVFPEIGPLKFRDLSDQETGMKAIDIKNDRYVVYASVMNDFTDDMLKTLDEEYRPLHTIVNHRIKWILYIRK